MIVVLNSEGFHVNERQLAKIRKQNGLWMRESRRSKSNGDEEEEGDDGLEELAQEESNDPTAGAGQKRQQEPQEEEAGVPEEIIAKRQERQARLMAESEEKLKSRTRRRRTRGWAGLPPDEGMGPRFPSELTLGESILELNLDKREYKVVRQNFEQICQAHNVVKKTICGPEKWNEVKQELIGRFSQLQVIFWGPEAPYLSQTQKPMALDVICMDVTKRLRTSGQHITIADAKNTLGLTPEEGREVRAAFDAILKADFFTGKLESTKEHWEELKTMWIDSSTRLRMALSLGEVDPAHAAKIKALESIARDVQKRNRDDQTKRVFPRERPSGKTPPSRSGPSNGTPLSSRAKISKPPKSVAKLKTPSQMQPRGQNYDRAQQHGEALMNQMNQSGNAEVAQMLPAARTDPMSTLASQALASAPNQTPAKDYTGMQIDPSLLEAASLPSHQHRLQQHEYDNEIFAQLQQATSLPQPAQKSIYFRLAPASLQKFPSVPKIWLDTLPVGNYDVNYLRTLALRKTGLEGMASAQRIEGLATGEGTEKWAIDEDDELEAYLLHVGMGKATFVVGII